MNRYETEYCQKIMKKMGSMKVSPLFFEAIKYPPRSLSHNRKNEKERITFHNIEMCLNNNMYTKEDWIRSMRSLFQTIQNEYREESIISLIAADLNNWFEKKIKFFPKDPQEEWLLKFSKAQKKSANILENSPFLK